MVIAFPATRDHMIVAPGEVLLQTRIVRRPDAVEPGGPVMAAVAGNRRVTSCERLIARIPIDRTAESRTRAKVESLVPLRWQWQAELELVLGRRIPEHLAVPV